MKNRKLIAAVVITVMAATAFLPFASADTDEWVVLENIGDDETLNHNWTESNYTEWAPFNDTTLDEVYSYNTSTHDQAYAIVNDTTVNRSQSLVWIQTNTSDTYAGVVYAHVGDVYKTVLYGANSVFLLDYNSTSDAFTNTNDSTSVTAPADAYNYWTQTQDLDPTASDGLWVKTIYDHRGQVMSKAWPTFGNEPTTWEVDFTDSSVRYDATSVNKGLFVWNPNTNNITTYFDNYNLWNLSYTTNTTGTWTPRMEFPSVDMEDVWEWVNETSGYDNLSVDETAEVLRNWTNMFNTESHIWYNTTADTTDQNDNIYYHTMCIYNISNYIGDYFDVEPEETGLPYSMLFIHITDCSDGDNNYLDSARVWIDVDNDQSWDDNDKMYWWYGNNTDDMGYIYTGTTVNSSAARFVYEANYPTEADPAYIHRYNSHKHYQAFIPVDDIKRSDGTTINETDVFGLHIDIADNGSTGSIPIWEAWNETGNTTVAGSESINFTSNWYPNMHYYSEPDTTVVPNSENMTRWGQGQIVAGAGGSYPGAKVDPQVTKTADVSAYTNGEQVNYTITIENTGDVVVTNVTLTEDYPSGFTFNASSIDAGNITNSNTTFNITDSLAVGETVTLWILCDVGTGFTGTRINNVTVTTDEGTINYAECALEEDTSSHITTDIYPVIVSLLSVMLVMAILVAIFKGVKKSMKKLK